MFRISIKSVLVIVMTAGAFFSGIVSHAQERYVQTESFEEYGFPLNSDTETGGDDILGDILSSPEAGDEPGRPETAMIGRLDVKEEDIGFVLDLIALESGLDIRVEEPLDGKVTLYVNNIPAMDALRIVLDMHDLVYQQTGDIISVMTKERYLAAYGEAPTEMLDTRIVRITSPVGDLIPVLNEMKTDSGQVYYNEQTRDLILVDNPESLRAMMDVVDEYNLPLETKTFTVQDIDGTRLKDTVERTLTPEVGSLDFDESTRQITITDTHSKVNEIEKLIESWNRIKKTISLETQIIQIILNEEHIMGVDWEAIVTDYQSLQFSGLEPAYDDAQLSVGTVSDEDYEILLDALDTVGVINTVSHIKTNVNVGNPAEITVRTVDLLEDLSRAEKATMVEANRKIKFQLTPKVSEEETVAVDIDPTVLEGEKQLKETEIPGITVDVGKGATVVMGGLFKELTIERTSKIPLLGDIPILGFVFRREGKSIQKSEVIIFVTVKQVEEAS